MNLSLAALAAATAAAGLAVLIGYKSIFADNFKPEQLRGKRVLVTGASMGIGEEIAYQYAKYGADIVITARSEDRLQKVVQHCQELSPGNSFHYVIADMSDLSQTNVLVQKAIEKLGGLDILVLNHIMLVDLAEWRGSAANLSIHDKLININYQSYIHLTAHAMPYLEESGGSLVVMSSIAGRYPQPYLASYSSSKHALEGFYHTLRQELILRKSPMSVTICVIGFTGTENAVGQLRSFGVKRILDTIPTQKPVDAAHAVVTGAAQRHNEVFFPYLMSKLISILRGVIPEMLDANARYMYTKD